jgi:N-acetylglucosamine-6-phosphate deacetylase
MLDTNGNGHRGRFRLAANGWDIYEFESANVRLDDSPYIVPLRPIDFHRHAIGGIDLSDFSKIDIHAVNQALGEEGLNGVLTSYLTRRDLSAFGNFARTFKEYKLRGELPHIIGFALEGPLLASPGGTPLQCVWKPTKEEWRALARCGEFGLKYIVLSPDAVPGPDRSSSGTAADDPSIQWIIELLLDAGISPALGHIRKTDPEAAAQAIQDIFEIAERQAATARCTPLMSDHLFNDMPRRIQHAWRTPEQRARRDVELEAMRIDDWQIDNVTERLGAVPGALIRGAHEGLISLCINFDGEHLDLAIARRMVSIIGADHIITLTDRVDGGKVARQQLFTSVDNRLLYRQDGAVAGGSIALDEQIANMRQIAISEEEIWKMVSINPCRVLGLPPEVDERGYPLCGSFIDANRSRRVFDARVAQI